MSAPWPLIAAPPSSTEVKGWRRKNRWLKAFHILLAQDFSGESFNRLEKKRFLCGNKGDRMTRFTGTSGASDAVHIILGNVGKIQIDHVRQLLNVNTPSRDIGCHKHPHTALLEPLKCTGAGTLTLVAVNRGRFESFPAELLSNPVGSMLCS